MLLSMFAVAWGVVSKQAVSAADAVPTQAYNHGEPTSEEQLMLELVNRARANPNAEASRLGIDLNEGIAPDSISSVPKQPLAFNPQLIDAARAHSLWMLENDLFTHVQTGGVDPQDRMVAAGYLFTGSFALGENIAFAGTTGPPLPVGPTVTQEHNDLFIDEGIVGRGHRLNLMNNAFHEVGIGVGLGVFTQGQDFNTVMTTQDFGTTQGNPGPFLIGVAYRDGNGDGFYTPGEGLAGVTVMPERGRFFATTSTSGGYAIDLGDLSGALQVTFSGGPLGGPVTKTINLVGQNAKLDFESIADAGLVFGFVRGSARRSTAGEFEVDLFSSANVLVEIEASENLLQWQKIGELSLTGAVTHFRESPPSTSTAHRFFRALKR